MCDLRDDYDYFSDRPRGLGFRTGLMTEAEALLKYLYLIDNLRNGIIGMTARRGL